LKHNKQILLLILLFPILGLSQNNIQQVFNKIKSEKILENASFSFRVIDLGNDSVIASYNPKNSLVPASTMKIVTTASALVKLGSYKTFKTKIQHDGFIDSNGILHGNLYIKGGGDPTLGSKYFLKADELQNDFMQKWIAEIQSFGIKSIIGKVIGDATIFSQDMVPSSWMWGDMGNYYGAGASGLSVYDNLMKIQFRTGKQNGDSTFVECFYPFLPNLTFDNQVKASKINRDKAYVFASPYNTNYKIQGTLPKNREEFIVKGIIYDPAYQTAYDLEYYLLQNGIEIQKKATTIRRMKLKGDSIIWNRKIIYTHISPSIGRIVYYTNHKSINLFAEHLLNQMAVSKSNEGSNFSGSIAVKSFWNKRINAKGMYVSDGSGMSRMNAISAFHLTSILRYIKKSKSYKSFYSSLPLAGKTGTMKRIGRKTYAQGRLRAKSGTMTRVKSYAGYVKSKSGKNLAFAIIVNNYNCYTSTMTKKLERIMVAIANY